MYSPLTKELITALQWLPGVGPKSAQRMAFQLLSKDKSKGLALAEAIALAIDKVGQCQWCRNFCEQDLCSLCADKKRDPRLLCVVENAADLCALEKTSSYHGLYFTLHGHLSPLEGIRPENLGIHQLLVRIQNQSIGELILATNATMEGEATAQYIVGQVDQTKTRCTRIAHGVPIGGELEYLDGMTLGHAFTSRMPIFKDS